MTFARRNSTEFANDVLTLHHSETEFTPAATTTICKDANLRQRQPGIELQ